MGGALYEGISFWNCPAFSLMENTLSSKIVFECPVFKVEEATVQLENRRVTKRWYVLKRDAVGIVPITKQGSILLLREYRSASAEYHWRIPAGGVCDNETPEAAAHRELREETGFDGHQMELIIELKSPSATIKQRSFFFLATELFSSPSTNNEDEDIEAVEKTRQEVLALIESGEIQGNIAIAIRKALADSGDV